MNPNLPRNHRPGVAPPQARQTLDPQYQVVCRNCGGEIMDIGHKLFRVAGQLVGTQDVTIGQVFVCRICRAEVNPAVDPVRGEPDVQPS